MPIKPVLADDSDVGHRAIPQHDEDASDLRVAIAMLTGIYERVAKKTRVHPSMVSRVARGERNSPKVSKAIREELRAIRDYLNRTKNKPNGW